MRTFRALSVKLLISSFNFRIEAVLPHNQHKQRDVKPATRVCRPCCWRYVAHLWGDDMPLVRERRVAIYCVLLAGLLSFWDGLCSDLWRSDNG